MIRQILTPEGQNISINLPKNFVGQKVEIIAFTIDDNAEATIVMDKPATYLASEKFYQKIG